MVPPFSPECGGERSVAEDANTALTRIPQTERAVVNPSQETYEAERREQVLVLAYGEVLKGLGSEIVRLRILPPGEAKPLYADLYDKSRNNLVEAKGTGTRNDIRMALAQLADYSRFIEPSPERAVLLLERPRRDLEELLLSQNLHVIWCDGESFTDNGDSRFT
jgi:hypothetical protein